MSWKKKSGAAGSYVRKLSKVVGVFARSGSQIDELSRRGGIREEKKGQGVMLMLIISLRAQGRARRENLLWMNPRRIRGARWLECRRGRVVKLSVP